MKEYAIINKVSNLVVWKSTEEEAKAATWFNPFVKTEDMMKMTHQALGKRGLCKDMIEYFKDQLDKAAMPTTLLFMAIGHESMGGPPVTVAVWNLHAIRVRGKWQIDNSAELEERFCFVEMLGGTNMPFFTDTTVKTVRELFKKYQDWDRFLPPEVRGVFG